MSPELVQLLAAVIQAAPALAQGILGALTAPAAEAVREQLVRDRARLDAAPLAGPATEAIVARYQARPTPARISAHHADVIARLVRPTSAALLTREERDALTDLVPVLRELADTDIPPVLHAPAGAWSEPSGSED